MNLSGAGWDNDIFVARSTDNGTTWSDPTFLNTNATIDDRYDEQPQVKTDGEGNWVALWISLKDQYGVDEDDDILVATSIDNGVT